MRDIWDPQLYGMFGDERRRPAIDLIARLPKADDGFAPRRIVDLGCGTGENTALLADVFARGQETAPMVWGVDSSDEMLARARGVSDAVIWQKADIAQWEPDEPLDLIFSNAALQWVPEHARLFPRLAGFLRPGGIMAIQVPNNFLAPSHQLIAEAAESWPDAVADVLNRVRIMRPGDYFDVLAPYCDGIDMWQTQYCHVLHGSDPVFDWTSATALRPVLAALPDDAAREQFCEYYKTRLRQVYPARIDGRTLFPFNRLFLVARKNPA